MIKISAESFCLLLLSPAILLVILESKISEREILFVLFGNLLSLIPGIIGVFLRRAYYSQTLLSCGNSITVEFGSFFSRRSARIGDNVYIGAYSILGTVSVGDGVLIASRVSIPSGRHQHMPSESTELHDGNRYDPITIGLATWVGEGAVVLASVGSNCIVGAGSVVVKKVADGVVVAGNPAADIRKNSPAARIENEAGDK